MSRSEQTGRRTCFEAGGHLKKDGRPCGYRIPAGVHACLHHSENKEAQRSMLEKAVRQRREAAIPDIDVKGFTTIDDCLAAKARVVEILCKDKVVEYRRLEMILKAATGASAIHATKAVEEQNKILLSLAGGGAGLAMLERLRSAKTRVLPGRRGPHLEVIPADKPESSPTPTESEEAEHANK